MISTHEEQIINADKYLQLTYRVSLELYKNIYKTQRQFESVCGKKLKFISFTDEPNTNPEFLNVLHPQVWLLNQDDMRYSFNLLSHFQIYDKLKHTDFVRYQEYMYNSYPTNFMNALTLKSKELNNNQRLNIPEIFVDVIYKTCL